MQIEDVELGVFYINPRNVETIKLLENIDSTKKLLKIYLRNSVVEVINSHEKIDKYVKDFERIFNK